MANTTVNSANQVDQWESKFFKEYVRDNRFKRYMGMNENSIIQLLMKLSKSPGDDLTISLVTRLQNSGVTGDSTLEGNEEELGNYGHKITIDQRRNAVAVGTMEQKKTHIQLLSAAKMMLKLWAMEQLRDDIITALQSPVVDGSTAYADASEAQKDAWLAANGQGVASNRVLFGAAKSNNAGDDHSVALANVDATTDVLQPTMVSLAKRMARDSDPHIRPVRVKEDEEWYVLFCNKWAFRDFKASSDYQTAAREAELRGKNNPLFRDGDLVWDGVILREIPEIPVITGVGDSGIDVAPNFLCGAQAVGVAWGSKTRAIKDTRDYGNIKGVGVAEILGVDKLMYNNIQHGLLTLYTAGVADS